MATRAEELRAEHLRECWPRWTRAVAAYVRGGSAPDPEAHAALHREVSEACRALAAASTGPDKEFYAYLEGLVRPWSTPSMLARSERDILQDVLNRCEEAERRLRGEDQKSGGVGVRVLAALAVGSVAGLVTLALAMDWWFRVFAGRLRDVFDDLWYAWRGLGVSGQLIAAGVGLAVLLLFVVARFVRR